MQAGVASYDIETGLNLIKKRMPAFSTSKGKQFALWDEGKIF
jgi:hypothetical protein